MNDSISNKWTNQQSNPFAISSNIGARQDSLSIFNNWNPHQNTLKAMPDSANAFREATDRHQTFNRLMTRRADTLDLNMLTDRSPQPEADEAKKENASNSKDDEQSTKRFIELLNGKPERNTRNVIKNSNRVELQIYRGFRGFLLFWWETLIRVDHFVAVVHFICIRASRSYVYVPYTVPLFALLLSIVTNAILNIVYDNQLRKASNTINSRAIDKFIFTKRRKLFQTKTWEDLEVGDIIKVTKNQELPADVLILDIVGQNNEQTCYVTSSQLVDIQTPQMKRSHQGTSNKTSSRLNDAKFIEQLSGNLKWECSPNGNFSGTLKLNDNPSAFEITMENIILRGSSIYHAHDSHTHILCLVLNVGDECIATPFRFLQDDQRKLPFFSGQISRSSNILQNQVNKLSVAHFLVALLIPIFFAVLKNFLLRNTNVWKFASIVEAGVAPFEFYICTVLFIFSNFPYLMHATFDFCALMHVLFISWDLNLVPSDVHVNNFDKVPKLGLINNIVLSRSAMFSLQSNEVVSVHFGGNQYFNEVDAEVQNLVDNQADKTNFSDSDSGSEDEQKDTIDYLPNEHIKHKVFINKEFLKMQEASASATSIQINELLKAITLCHSSSCTVKANQSSFQQGNVDDLCDKRDDFQGLQKSEKAQLWFASSFGYRFVQKKNKIITIYCAQQQLRFQELFYTEMTKDNQTINVQIVSPFGTNQYKMLVKGPLSELRRIIHSEYSIDFDAEQVKYIQRGITAIAFCEKNLEQEEAEMLEKLYQEFQNQNRDSAWITAEFLSWATESISLNCLGIIGLKRNCNLRKSLVLEEAFRNEIKVWIVTDGNEAQTLTDCNQLKILQNCNQPMNIKGNDEREIEAAIKTHLRQLVDRRPNQQGPGSDSKRTSRDDKRSRKNRKKSDVPFQQKDVVFFTGNSLKHILKDETIKKTFLLLCSMCSYMIGSEVSALQKAELVRQIKAYNKISDLGFVLGVVSSPHDQYMIGSADVTVGLNNRYKKTDCINGVDIKLQDLYGLSYLLFKHGTQYCRRVANVQGLFNYRTVLLDLLAIFLFIMSDFSGTAMFPYYWHAVFICLVTPIMFFVVGSFGKDVCSEIAHRIFGEYKNNHAYSGICVDISFPIYAIVDAAIMLLIFIQCWGFPGQTPINISENSFVEFDTMMVYWIIILSAIVCIRMRTTFIITIPERLASVGMAMLSLLFVFELGDLMHIQDFYNSPQLLLHLLFAVLTIWMTTLLQWIYVGLLPTEQYRRREFYEAIEEKLIFEEYEDPSQEFCVDKREPFFAKLEKKFNQKRMLGINKNMMKLHRSDSLDEILEKINAQGDTDQLQGKKFDNSTNVIDKVSLKLNDINKELEYQTQVRERKIVQTSVKKIYVMLALFAFLLIEGAIYKLVMTQSKKKGATSLLDPNRTVFSDNTNLIYINLAQVLSAAIVIFIIVKGKDLRADLVMFAYIGVANVLMCVQILVDANNSLNTFMIFFILMFSFVSRQYAVYLIVLICLTTCFTFATVYYNTSTKLIHSEILKLTTHHEIEEMAEFIDIYIQIANIFIIITFWLVYAYQDELSKKIQFVTSMRKSKEYTKLLQIINILIPSLVRDRIKEGQKNFSDAQGEVTCIFVDIDQFDSIVSNYNGRELIELLDHLYLAFDQLCEQYGLAKIETVGKTYMACGGLKFFESQIDQRLLSNHHSVRCTDFAFEAVAVADKKMLKSGQKCTLKVGIHTGEVISGVVGETKPQFSLIGETVNKTSRVCSKCAPKSVLVSKETYGYLQANSNNFQYTVQEVEMKGLGLEKVYTVRKKSNDRFKKTKFPKQISKTADSKSKHQAKAQVTKQLKKDESPLIEEGNESFRSSTPIDNSSDKYDSVQNSVYSEDKDDEKMSNEASEDEDEALMLQQINFAQFKDDRVIVKNPSLNARYNLVERPRFLMQFELKDKENEYTSVMLRQNKGINAIILGIKSLFDSMMAFSLTLKFLPLRMMWVSIFWIIGYFSLQFVLNWKLEQSLTPETSWLLALQVGINFAVSLALVLIQNFFLHARQIREMTKIALLVLVLFCYVIKSYPVRYTVILMVAIAIFWLTLQVFYYVWKTVDLITLLTQQLIIMICVGKLYYLMFTRAMQQRKQYNRDRIIDVEIEKNDELLSKLVPIHVLRGLKNDERIVEQIDNVTLLYTDMVGFTAFSKAVKRPQEVVQLLSQLFSKFDQLVESQQVYKVHTIGDCYVVSGYTGKTNKYRRNEMIQVEEAYRVVQVGFEMIEIIRNVREQTKEPLLKNLDMRIGIHTGRVVGGIIGTKVVRYDIFGNDVLIANKMESNGVDSQVVISEATFQLLNKNQAIMDRFDFTFHKEVDIPALGKTVTTYLVERITVQSNDSLSYDSESFEEPKVTSDPTTKSTKSKKNEDSDNEQKEESDQDE